LTRVYPVIAQVASLILVVLGTVMLLAGALDLIESVSRLTRSVMYSVGVDTDISVGLLRGPLYLVVGVLLLAISLPVGESLERAYHQIKDALL